MKRIYSFIMLLMSCVPAMMAQSNVTAIEGKCGRDIKWMFDGYTLQLETVKRYYNEVAEMPDYDLTLNKAPWVKKGLNVKVVKIGRCINRIGSCAFANCDNLQEVVFEAIDICTIGWGAFLNCTRLKTISLPVSLNAIETIAFGNCSQLPSISIPDRCRVGNQAFVSCTNLHSIEMGPTTILGSQVFVGEVKVDGKILHTLYDKEIRKLPSYVTIGNSREYGLSPASVEKALGKGEKVVDYDQPTSDVDSNIPSSLSTRQNTYALIIGNQNYRFAGNVPYAIHDARVFADYCKQALGLPVENIHVVEDGTKQMIIEEELQNWLATITKREGKKLMVYYAGHGVPDVKESNKSYLLPTDVRGTNPKLGIALDDFYSMLNKLSFHQTTVFVDACFSGTNRDSEGVIEGMRDVVVEAEETTIDDGNMVVMSAVSGNETAQGFAEEGHGLFTYYLLKELQETAGVVSLGVLFDILKTHVSQKSKQLTTKTGVKLYKEQTPSITTSKVLGDSWRQLEL